MTAIHRRWTATLVALAIVIAGAAGGGQAATTNSVTATLSAMPPSVSPEGKIRYDLIVANEGTDTAAKVVATDEIPGAKLVAVSSSLCTGLGTTTMTCSIGNLAGGATFAVAYVFELLDGTTGPIENTVSGTFDPQTPTRQNKRTSDTFTSNMVSTPVVDDADFASSWVLAFGQSLETDATGPQFSVAKIPTSPNGVAAVLEEFDPAGKPGACGAATCLGQVIEFTITGVSTFDTNLELTATVAGSSLPPGTLAKNLTVYHNGEAVPLCSTGLTDAAGGCIASITQNPPTKDVVWVFTGPSQGSFGAG